MNPPQCDDLDYIHFLIAAQRVFTCTEAARCQPQAEDAPAHDAFTRLLQRQPFNTEALGRQVNSDDRNVISSVDIPPEGRVVHLRGFGWVKVFQKVSRDGDLEYFATNDLQMTEGKRADLERQGWGIEVYHRGLKRCGGAERVQARKATAILKHLLLCLRAFLRLEVYHLRTGVSWYEAKLSIVRDAIRSYLAHPAYALPSNCVSPKSFRYRWRYDDGRDVMAAEAKTVGASVYSL